MAFKALPYGSQDTAIWHSSHCHMAVKPLPYGTQVTAIWQSSHCHMTVKPLPYGTQAIAIWHSSHCHMAVKSLPYGSQATAIWQSRHCHRHVAQICHNPCCIFDQSWSFLVAKRSPFNIYRFFQILKTLEECFIRVFSTVHCLSNFCPRDL